MAAPLDVQLLIPVIRMYWGTIDDGEGGIRGVYAISFTDYIKDNGQGGPPYDRREDFRNTALQLQENQNLSDCGRLALLAYKAGQIATDANDITRTLLSDLTEYSNITWTGRTSSDAAFRVGVFTNNPYYGRGFSDSGFNQLYRDQSNQVRHFVGWFAAGRLLNETVANIALYQSEGSSDPTNPDVALGLAAIRMGSSFNGDAQALAQGIWHEICGQQTDLNLPPIKK